MILATNFEHSSVLVSVEDLDEDGEEPRVDASHTDVFVVVIVKAPSFQQAFLLDCSPFLVGGPSQLQLRASLLQFEQFCQSVAGIILKLFD